MDADCVNPFIEAALKVLETTASISVKARKPYLKKEREPTGEATGLIKLSGDFAGTIAVSFADKLILSIVSKMFGEEMKEMNDEIKDAVGELTNMICGQVTTMLSEGEMSLKAELSEVIMGHGRGVEHLENRPVIAMPYVTETGEFTIEVCFEK